MDKQRNWIFLLQQNEFLKYSVLSLCILPPTSFTGSLDHCSETIGTRMTGGDRETWLTFESDLWTVALQFKFMPLMKWVLTLLNRLRSGDNTRSRSEILIHLSFYSKKFSTLVLISFFGPMVDVECCWCGCYLKKNIRIKENIADSVQTGLCPTFHGLCLC